MKQKGGKTWNFTADSADALLVFQKAVEARRAHGPARSCEHERSIHQGLSARARRPDAGVVHAAGRALHGRVPGAAREAHDARGVPDAGARGRGHAAAAPRRSTSTPPSSSPTSSSRSRRWASPSTSTRARARSSRRRCARPATSRRCAPSSRARSSATSSRRSASCASELQGAAHRLRRRAVHARVLRDRGRPLEPLREDQGADVRRAGDLAPPRRAPRRRRGRLPARAGRGGRAGGAALRLLDRARSTRPTTASSSSRTSGASSTASRTSTSRRSTSAPAPGTCSRCSARPAGR